LKTAPSVVTTRPGAWIILPQLAVGVTSMQPSDCDAEVTIPLSADVAICGRNGPVPMSTWVAVEMVNGRTSLAAERFVIAANRTALVCATGLE